VAYENRTSGSPDPDPAETAGMTQGGGVRPGDTPPMADSMSEAGEGERTEEPNMGPVSGNRTPMIITLSVLAVIILLAAGFIATSLLAS